MTVPLGLNVLQRIQPVVGVEIEQERLQLRHLAIPRDVHLRKPVDGPNAGQHGLKLSSRNCVRFVHHQHIRVADLQMRGREMLLRSSSSFLQARGGILGQGSQNVLGVDESDDAVEVDVAAKAVVDPEERCEVPGIGEPGGFEDYVRNGWVVADEGFN